MLSEYLITKRVFLIFTTLNILAAFIQRFGYVTFVEVVPIIGIILYRFAKTIIAYTYIIQVYSYDLEYFDTPI